MEYCMLELHHDCMNAYLNIKLTCFTARHGCDMLVYYRAFARIEEAVAEEDRLNDGDRLQILKLIEGKNPQWNDLWEEIKN